MFRCIAVHTQSNNVKRQLYKMLHVPRVSGSLTQEGAISLFRAVTFCGSAVAGAVAGAAHVLPMNANNGGISNDIDFS